MVKILRRKTGFSRTPRHQKKTKKEILIADLEEPPNDYQVNFVHTFLNEITKETVEAKLEKADARHLFREIRNESTKKERRDYMIKYLNEQYRLKKDEEGKTLYDEEGKPTYERREVNLFKDIDEFYLPKGKPKKTNEPNIPHYLRGEDDILMQLSDEEKRQLMDFDEIVADPRSMYEYCVG